MKINVRVFNNTEQKYIPVKLIQSIVEITLIENNINQAEINVILVTDEEIHRLNKSYLKHDRPTDVITFSLEEDTIEGEIYISLDTAFTQSKEYRVPFRQEILRLACHGALHLAGFDYKTKDDRLKMNQMESEFISKIINKK